MKRPHALWTPCVLALVVLAMVTAEPSAEAQTSGQSEGTSNTTVSNPYLLLIHDRAVLEALRLSDDQRKTMRRATDGLDQPLLAMRAQGPKASAKTFEQLLAAARGKLKTVLSDQQRQRLDQIVLQAQGRRALLRPDVAEQLALSAEQQTNLQSIIRDTQQAITEAQRQSRKEESRTKLSQETARLREDELRRIQAVLSDTQKQQWTKLVGDPFDTSRLGQMAFKAPDLSSATAWINASPMEMAGLQGKVVALHFWTYG